MPFEVIEQNDPVKEMMRFQVSPIYEMIVSLQNLNWQQRHLTWIREAEAALSNDFLAEMNSLYDDFYHGFAFLELAVDYENHDDVQGFIDYVREIAPEQFVYYLLGRWLAVDEISETQLNVDALISKLKEKSEKCDDYVSLLRNTQMTQTRVVQNRLADVLQEYWDVYFQDHIKNLQPLWQGAINEKQNSLSSMEGSSFLQSMTGKSDLPAPMPADYPITDIVFIPMVLIPRRIYLFYGYGNVTIMFDAQRTSERMEQIERRKDDAILTLKALADDNRLKILQLIVHPAGKFNGKAIAEKLNLSPSAVSRHISQLRDGGLIEEESVDNRNITYTFKRDTLENLADVLYDYLYS